MEEHEPVLIDEVKEFLNITQDGIYLDGTLGRGGHAECILEEIIKGDGLLIGIDKDQEAIAYCQKKFPEDQVKLFQGSFLKAPEILQQLQISAVDGILLDLGVSSPQLDNPARGFSYQDDAPLDMRMDQSQELTAAKIVNNYEQDQLTKIISKYGEERWASRIAEFIVDFRERKPLESTYDLIDVIKAAIPASARRSGGHPARRTFQALRIETNNELQEVEDFLQQVPTLLRTGGRIGVISFHSLEDRIVKHTFKHLAEECLCPPDFPVCRCDKKAELKIITRSPVQPGEKEIKQNPRSRSAKFRVAEKLAVT